MNETDQLKKLMESVNHYSVVEADNVNEDNYEKWDYEADAETFILLRDNNPIAEMPIDEWRTIVKHYMKMERNRD